MKAVILCAGRGRRTGLTYPKCLYEFKKGVSLLDKNINAIKKLGFKNSDIVLATGFKEALIKRKTKNLYTYIKNKKFNSTNMIYSLNEVIKKFGSQTYYVFYADIIFEFNAIKTLKKTNNKITTLVDTDWLRKWKLKRNYLDDLEDLKITNGKLVSLGRKVKNVKKIDGRFIGITKFSESIIRELIDKNIIHKNLKNNKKLDFTNFLMRLIKDKFNVHVLKKKINWFEFDEPKDFEIYAKIYKK